MSNTVTKEVTLEEMCKEIFSKPPKPPCSSEMQLHENCAKSVEKDEESAYVFDMFKNVLYLGISIVFPDYCVNGNKEKKTIQLSKMRMEDFELIRKYMQSLGYDVCLCIKPMTEDEYEISRAYPKEVLNAIFKDEIKDDFICKCGWSKKTNKNNFSNHYLHFIRSDKLAVSLHFKIYSKLS